MIIQNEIIAGKAEKEAIKLEGYNNMIKNLEHHLESEDLVEEAERVREGFIKTYKNISVSS
jgi:hypothetical protein